MRQTGRIASQPVSGMRQDLKKSFRSRWEANIARYFNYMKIQWEYEPCDFEFKKIKRGSRYYKPDFYLPETNNYLEVKGFMSASDKTKLRRFKKYYPKESKRLQFVIYNPLSKSVENGKVMHFLLNDLEVEFCDIYSYKEIKEKLGSLIPNWE